MRLSTFVPALVFVCKVRGLCLTARVYFFSRHEKTFAVAMQAPPPVCNENAQSNAIERSRLLQLSHQGEFNGLRI